MSELPTCTPALITIPVSFIFLQKIITTYGMDKCFGDFHHLRWAFMGASTLHRSTLIITRNLMPPNPRLTNLSFKLLLYCIIMSHFNGWSKTFTWTGVQWEQIPNVWSAKMFVWNPAPPNLRYWGRKNNKIMIVF